MKTKNNKQRGISLIEILVVVAIFAFVGTLVTRSIILVLQGTNKSTSVVNARENLDYVMGIVERQIRNANSIADCSNSNTNTISYLDQNGVASYFSCVYPNGPSDPTGSYIASGSASLTDNTVKITSCSFTCSTSGSKPPVISISLTLKDASNTVSEGGDVSASTQIDLMNY